MKASPSLKFSAIFFFLGHFFCLRSFMAKNKMWRNWNMECRKHFEWIFWAETWSITAAFEKKLYSLHQWHLRRLLRLSYLRHVTNMEVLRLTCQTQLSTTLRDKRLRLLFIATADSRTDHAGVLRSIILGLPIDLKRQVLPVFHEEIGFVRLNRTCGRSTSARCQFGNGLRSWTVEADSGHSYALGWVMLLMMMVQAKPFPLCW